MLVSLIAVSAVPVSRAEFKTEDWEFIAPVTLHLTAEASAGIIEMSLSPEIMDRSRPDLGDVRIIGKDGREVPYVLERTRAVSKTEEFPGRVYNRTFVPGKSSSATADLGRQVRKNRVRVVTEGSNFRRQVMIEGSDNCRNWQTVRRGAFLFRIGASGNTEYEKDTVSIPDNDMRYFRVTVLNGADDPDQVKITEVLVRHHAVEPARICPVQIAGTSVEQKDRHTILEFDLRYRHMPLRDLKLSFKDANFFRCVRICGRQKKTSIMKHAVEDAKALERRVPEPWTLIRTGAIFRYSGEEGDESSLTIDLSGSSHRYIRVEIANEDNTPLAFTGAEASRHMCLVCFPFQAEGKPRLFFGSPKARFPQYDISHYAERLASKGINAAVAGKAIKNPVFEKTRAPTPWSEKHPVILWVALLAGVVVLGVLVASQMRTRGNPGQ